MYILVFVIVYIAMWDVLSGQVKTLGKHQVLAQAPPSWQKLQIFGDPLHARQ